MSIKDWLEKLSPEEFKEHQRKAAAAAGRKNKGKKRKKPRSQEAIDKSAAAHRGMAHSQETKDKISNSKKGKPNLARRGISRTQEEKDKISAAKKGKKNPKVSESNKARRGQKQSPELVERRRQGLTGIKRPYMIERNKAQAAAMTPEEHEAFYRKLGMIGNEAAQARIAAMTLEERTEYYRKVGEGRKATWDLLTPEERATKCKSWIEAGLVARKFKDTKPELAFEKMLKELGWQEGTHYERERVIGKYRADFLIPSENLIIEINGCYVHCCEQCGYNDGAYGEPAKERRERDARRTAYLESRGYTIQIVWEHELTKALMQYAAFFDGMLPSVNRYISDIPAQQQFDFGCG